MLEIIDLKFGYGAQELFNKASVTIYNGEHVGLIGLNGVGKSTLMNLLAFRLTPDEGKIIWDKNVTFSYLDQQLEVKTDISITDYLYDVYTPLFKKEEEMNNLYNSLVDANPDDYDKILRKAENIQTYLDENNFYMIKSKIGNVINGLGIDIEDGRSLKELSGGQRAKVFLGKMLLEEKDVLLLDEPTNFLDARHVEWLTKFLTGYKNSFIVISHNVEFLNNVCDVTLVLENKLLARYKGNYDAYLKQHEVNRVAYEKAYNRQQAFIKHQQDFINKNLVRASTTHRAQSRQKLLNKLEVMEKPAGEKPVHFNFEFTKSFHKSPLIVNDLSIGYTHPILEHINLKLEFGKKYVIIGKNGIGKTTFVKTILGKLEPLAGSYELTDLNTIYYYAQEETPDDFSAIQYFRNDYPQMDDKQIRGILARYGVSGELPLKSMKYLSGGEAAKVRFAKLSLTKSNLLILDEPTNHLDKLAKKSLFEKIATYPGTVILVSHEKSFYDELKMIHINFD